MKYVPVPAVHQDFYKQIPHDSREAAGPELAEDIIDCVFDGGSGIDHWSAREQS